jgi:DNA-directed RNA polymerase subunit RPC12/RpoP
MEDDIKTCPHCGARSFVGQRTRHQNKCTGGRTPEQIEAARVAIEKANAPNPDAASIEEINEEWRRS